MAISSRDQYEEVIQAEICPSVFTLEMSEKSFLTAAEKVGKDCRMHFAVDTGMSRIGYQVTEEAADPEMAQIAKLPHMIVEGIFTHFAKADEYDKTFTKEQIQKFRKMIAMMEDRGVSIPCQALFQQRRNSRNPRGKYGYGKSGNHVVWIMAIGRSRPEFP